MQTEFSSSFDRVCQIIEKHNREPNKLIPVLQEIQSVYAYLPEDIMTYVATALGISPSTVFGVATFYSHFTLEPKGKYVIKICDGTACHVKKSEEILGVLQKELGLSNQKQTSDDRLFTVETVACLGACGLAPVITVNDQVHGAMNADKTRALLQTLREEAAADA